MIRRLLRRPPTVQECIRATLAESGSTYRHHAPVPDTTPRPAPRPSQHRPARPWYRDPYAGVVTGPLLVERTKWINDWHQKRYGDDVGFPEIEWGTFSVEDV